MTGRARSVVAAGCFAVAGLGLGVQGAAAQLVVPTGQTREVRGQSEWTDAGGNEFSTGLMVSAAPEGYYGSWVHEVPIPGFISGMGMLMGGFDEANTFSVDAITMSLGGGNGPGTSAAASLEIEFTYTFDVTTSATYTANTVFGVAGPSGAPDTLVDFSGIFTLIGPGGEVFRHETTAENGYSVAVVDATGSLPAGTYTLTFLLSGDVAFSSAPDDPDGNGAGGGGGGPSPLMTFRIDEGGGCPVDWNTDGDVNSGDISSFLTSWIASVSAPDLVADFNGDGQTNSGDISAFLTAWIDAVTNGC